MNLPKLYLIPGFLTDKTIYKDFLEDDRFDCEVLEFIPTESAEESIENYAGRLAEKIDKSGSFSILGTSFGGILAVEIAKESLEGEKSVKDIVIERGIMKEEQWKDFIQPDNITRPFRMS